MILTETTHLIIRSWKEDDIEAYANIVSDKKVMEFINEGIALTHLEAATYIKDCIQSYQKNGWSRFAVELKSTNELVGFCGYKQFNNELDFGWRFARRFWGKGIGSEAAKAVLELGLKKFSFPRIVCIVYPNNKASIRIIEKLNFNFEKTILLNNIELLQYSISNPNHS